MKPDLLKHPPPRCPWFPYFVLGVSLLLTALFTYYTAITAKAKDQLRFEKAVERTQNDIQNRLETYIALLRGGSGLFAASDRVSQAEFRAYVDRLELRRRYPGIQGIGFSVRVRQEEPEFKRAEYHSVIYLEPLDRLNKVAIGFNMFAEPVRRAAMERARDTGTPAASGRVTLVQEIDQQKQAGFLIYVPVYRKGVKLNTVAQRRAALRGFVYSPFRVEDLLQGIFGSEQQPLVDFQLYDGTELSSKNVLHHFSHNQTANGSSYQPRFTTTKNIKVAGQIWSISFASRPEFERVSEKSLVAYILLGGLLLSFVLFSVTRSQVYAHQRLQRLNASLERQVQERTAQLQQALDFEATLKRIADKVRDSLDEHQILQTAVQELALILGIICCDAALYNLADGTSTICYAYTASSHEETLRTPSSMGCVVQMTDFPQGYYQLLQGQYFQFCEITPDAVRSQVAILACPIVDDQGVLGDLWLFKHKEDSFNELEIRLVQQVANQCAIAIRQARLYQTSLAQVQELEKLNQLKDDFLSTVSHELRTPIANMKMAIQMLKVAGGSHERRERYLEILQAECNRESELINDLLDLQRLEIVSYPIMLSEAVSLQDWLPGVIEPFQVRTGQRQQSLQIELPRNLPVIVSDRASLERILAELLNNACKYTPAGGEIVLSVCYNSTEAVTIFSLSNSIEISAVDLPHIFDKFYRVPNTDPWKQGGTGLGLSLVQKLVERLQGKILVESSRGWTTFTVQLPNQPRT